MKHDDKRALWIPKTTDRLCSLRFKIEYFDSTSARRQLHSSAVPSIFLRQKERRPSERHIRYESNYGQVPVLHEQPSASGVHKYRVQLHNVKRREKRLRLTVATIKEKLAKETKIKESLLQCLNAYKGT